MPNTEKPDDAEGLAKQAYEIYRGMKFPMTDPHWDDLDRPQKGLLEWVVRWTKLQSVDD